MYIQQRIFFNTNLNPRGALLDTNIYNYVQCRQGHKGAITTRNGKIKSFSMPTTVLLKDTNLRTKVGVECTGIQEYNRVSYRIFHLGGDIWAV